MPGSARAWMEAETQAQTQVDVATGAALFDLSSYTGGAPLIPMGDGAAQSIFDQDVELVAKSSDAEEKKMGRPSHPAWQFFVRGEKRNRFHHNAYCRFCSENGESSVAVRGVSGNMIRHLQKCIYCPAEVVTQLKLRCARKDAASFNKKHQANRSVDVFLQDASPAATKKPRRSGGQGEAARDAAMHHRLASNESPMTHAANKAASPEAWMAQAAKHAASPDALMAQAANNAASPDALNKLVASSTMSAGLPWDWVWTEQSARVFGDLHQKVDPPTAELLAWMGTTSHEKQILKMKDEPVGVTLAVSWWVAKYPRSSFVLLSLVNALGEATAWEVIDMGIEETAPETLAEKIKANLTDLRRRGIHVINIVADTALAYAASRLAVSSSEWTSLAIPVLPCFAHLLQLLLGVVLTVSEKSTETIGEVVELVRTFSNHRVLKVLRRECGDPDAVLHAPTKTNWYSFIEAIDSVRQYEDMIKIISSKVVQASTDSRETSGQASNMSKSINSRKDSAGNTVDELAECGLSSASIRTIQNADFWENVVALSELMSPLKETHKMMTSNFTPAFSLSDIFYQFGRMQQQYSIILSDWEDSAGGGRSAEQVRFLLQTVNEMWKLYDQPLMVLGYTFNYNLQHPFFARHQPSLQWLSIGKYAKQYFRGWFCAASSTRNPSRLLALSDEAAAQFMEDILAFKERKYPFDSESMCDFENPKFFYMLVSDSHPLMHMFGSRLFSFVTSTPPLSDVLPGKCFIPSAPSMTCSQQALLPILRMQLFAQTAMRPSKDLLGFVQSNRPKRIMTGSGMQLHPESMSETDDAAPTFLQPFNPAGRAKNDEADSRTSSTEDRIWSKKQWTAMAKEWKAHWEKETDTSNLLQTSRVLDTFTPDLTLDQIFKDKLPSRLPHDREDAVVDV